MPASSAHGATLSGHCPASGSFTGLFVIGFLSLRRSQVESYAEITKSYRTQLISTMMTS